MKKSLLQKTLSVVVSVMLLAQSTVPYALIYAGPKEAGDAAWDSCKRAGGSDEQCRGQAEAAYNQAAQGQSQPQQQSATSNPGGSEAAQRGSSEWDNCKREGKSDEQCRHQAEAVYHQVAKEKPPTVTEATADRAADEARKTALSELNKDSSNLSSEQVQVINEAGVKTVQQVQEAKLTVDKDQAKIEAIAQTIGKLAFAKEVFGDDATCTDGKVFATKKLVSNSGEILKEEKNVDTGQTCQVAAAPQTAANIYATAGKGGENESCRDNSSCDSGKGLECRALPGGKFCVKSTTQVVTSSGVCTKSGETVALPGGKCGYCQTPGVQPLPKACPGAKASIITEPYDLRADRTEAAIDKAVRSACIGRRGNKGSVTVPGGDKQCYYCTDNDRGDYRYQDCPAAAPAPQEVVVVTGGYQVPVSKINEYEAAQRERAAAEEARRQNVVRVTGGYEVPVSKINEFQAQQKAREEKAKEPAVTVTGGYRVPTSQIENARQGWVSPIQNVLDLMKAAKTEPTITTTGGYEVPVSYIPSKPSKPTQTSDYVTVTGGHRVPRSAIENFRERQKEKEEAKAETVRITGGYEVPKDQVQGQPEGFNIVSWFKERIGQATKPQPQGDTITVTGGYQVPVSEIQRFEEEQEKKEAEASKQDTIRVTGGYEVPAGQTAPQPALPRIVSTVQNFVNRLTQRPSEDTITVTGGYQVPAGQATREPQGRNLISGIRNFISRITTPSSQPSITVTGGYTVPLSSIPASRQETTQQDRDFISVTGGYRVPKDKVVANPEPIQIPTGTLQTALGATANPIVTSAALSGTATSQYVINGGFTAENVGRVAIQAIDSAGNAVGQARDAVVNKWNDGNVVFQMPPGVGASGQFRVVLLDGRNQPYKEIDMSVQPGPEVKGFIPVDLKDVEGNPVSATVIVEGEASAHTPGESGTATIDNLLTGHTYNVRVVPNDPSLPVVEKQLMAVGSPDAYTYQIKVDTLGQRLQRSTEETRAAGEQAAESIRERARQAGEFIETVTPLDTSPGVNLTVETYTLAWDLGIVHSTHNNLANVNVYLDGKLVGKTDNDGAITVPTTTGDHVVAVEYTHPSGVAYKEERPVTLGKPIVPGVGAVRDTTAEVDFNLTGTINVQGTITSASPADRGSLIPTAYAQSEPAGVKATVSLIDSNGISHNVLSDENGQFILVIPGNDIYTLTVAAVGKKTVSVQKGLSSSFNYAIDVQMEDGASQELGGGAIIRAVGSKMNLAEGWNAISPGVLPNYVTSAEELLAEIARQGGYATTVARFVAGRWQLFVQRGTISFGDNFPIEAGVGYYLRVHLPADLVFPGVEIPNTPAYTLVKGYNLVGIISENQGLTAEGLLNSINTVVANAGRTVTDFDQGLLEPFIKDEGTAYGEDFPIQSQKGYFIRVLQDVTWKPE